MRFHFKSRPKVLRVQTIPGTKDSILERPLNQESIVKEAASNKSLSKDLSFWKKCQRQEGIVKVICL
ncbi:MAG: hypothetical protein ACI4ON_00040 [Clostridia bacterium]